MQNNSFSPCEKRKAPEGTEALRFFKNSQSGVLPLSVSVSAPSSG